MLVMMNTEYEGLAVIVLLCIRISQQHQLSIQESTFAKAQRKFCADYPIETFNDMNKATCSHKCHGSARKCIGFCLNLNTELCTIYLYPKWESRETIEYEGRSYFYVEEKLNCTAAEQDCQESGGALAITRVRMPIGEGFRQLEGPVENNNNYIYNGIIKKPGTTEFKFLDDGSVLSRTDKRWSSGKPNDVGEEGNCVELTYFGSFLNRNDTRRCNYYCQSPRKCPNAPYEGEAIEKSDECYLKV